MYKKSMQEKQEKSIGSKKKRGFEREWKKEKDWDLEF